MARTWWEGSLRGLRYGAVSNTWEDRLMQRKRIPGSRNFWRAGDFCLLDIDASGRFGRLIPDDRRALALCKTFRYRWDGKPQLDGRRLKRWYDYVLLHRARRRGRFSGWRLAHGTWNCVGRGVGFRRFEWQVNMGRVKFLCASFGGARANWQFPLREDLADRALGGHRALRS